MATTLAAGGSEVYLWDTAADTLLKTLTGHPGWVDSVTFSIDGTTLATVSGDGVYLWDVEAGTLINTLTEHTHRVMSVAFSPDGTTLASTGLDETVRLWDVGN